jgi:uncharacterized RDD family membrane protein YckC
VIRICPKCGALLLDDTDSCSFCTGEASQNHDFLEPVAAGAGSSAEYRAESAGSANASGSARAASSEPDWRSEVSRRLEQYRVRRGRLRHDDTQPGLPFREPQAQADDDDAADGAQFKAETRARLTLRQRQTERVEIRIQPELDFSASPDDRAHPQTALVPVASLAERRWAGALDAIFLAFTCAGFLGLFRSLGGEIMVAKTDVAVYAVAAYLFYSFYVSLFTVLAGSTPGMQLGGLAVVRLDGSLPDTRQLLWRSFGYMLSAATLLLGFVWALWDEDHFTWQDRISQTYVTAAVPIADFDAFSVPASGHRFAHK